MLNPQTRTFVLNKLFVKAFHSRYGVEEGASTLLEVEYSGRERGRKSS